MKTGTKPEFTVIVPVYGHWDLLPHLLAALQAQTLDQDCFEILLVNNEAPRDPPPLDLPANARILPCTEPGSYAARNAGAAVARGNFLVFTDADCQPDPNWLTAFDAGAKTNTGLLAGPVEMLSSGDTNPYATFDMIRGIPQARYVARGYATTANLMVPRSVFQHIGGFDTTRLSGGDAAFCRLASTIGYGLELVDAAIIRHPCRTTWPELKTKARRIKGGQIAAGSLRRRLAWGLRTLSPPVRDTRAFLQAPYPASARATAIAVRFRLWSVELAEMFRLLLGGTPERQ